VIFIQDFCHETQVYPHAVKRPVSYGALWIGLLITSLSIGKCPLRSDQVLKFARAKCHATDHTDILCDCRISSYSVEYQKVVGGI
jgi:hypothetical protein